MNEKQMGYGSYKGNKTFFSVFRLIYVLSALLMCISGIYVVNNDDTGPTFYIMAIIFLILNFGFMFLNTQKNTLRCLPCEITITDKRVYGSIQSQPRARENRPVDISLFEITAVEVSQNNELVINTKTERLMFHCLENARELSNILNGLLDKESTEGSMDEKELGYGYSEGNKTASTIAVSCYVIWLLVPFFRFVLFGTEIGFGFVISLLIKALLFVLLMRTIGLSWKPCKITITDEKIYGFTYGKQISFPLSSITAAELSDVNNLVIHVGAKSVKFNNLKNAGTLKNIIDQQLVQKQEKTALPKNNIEKPQPVSNNLDDIKKLKELLDCGLITQEEFDAKKKQILGL